MGGVGRSLGRLEGIKRGACSHPCSPALRSFLPDLPHSLLSPSRSPTPFMSRRAHPTTSMCAHTHPTTSVGPVLCSHTKITTFNHSQPDTVCSSCLVLTVQVVSVDSTGITLGGADIVDGSPVLDLKPYLPFVDSVPSASAPSWVTVSGTGGRIFTCIHTCSHKV